MIELTENSTKKKKREINGMKIVENVLGLV